MRFSRALRFPWRLLILAAVVGALAIAGLSSQTARAAPERPLVGCSPCISVVSPADGATASLGADGKVTISFSAQLDNNFSRFVLSVDNTPVDAAQIQVTDPDPTQPTGQYRTALSAGQHQAFVQVYDTAGLAASFGWAFTAPQAPTPTPTPANAPAGGSNAGGTTPASGSGLLSAQTLSIILFSIAGLGVVVMSFIAGMWYGGRRWLNKQP